MCIRDSNGVADNSVETAISIKRCGVKDVLADSGILQNRRAVRLWFENWCVVILVQNVDYNLHTGGEPWRAVVPGRDQYTVPVLALSVQRGGCSQDTVQPAEGELVRVGVCQEVFNIRVFPLIQVHGGDGLSLIHI